MKKSMAVLLNNQKHHNPNLTEPTAAAASTGVDEILMDNATGRRYSWNPVTNETRWMTASNPLSQILRKDDATDAAAAPIDVDEILTDEATGRKYSFSRITGESKWL